jgi:hypothetical protein
MAHGGHGGGGGGFGGAPGIAGDWSLLLDAEPSARAQAEALIRAMTGQQSLGLMGQLSGDKVIAPVGQSLVSQSNDAMGRLGQTALARKQLENQQMSAQHQMAAQAEAARHNLATEALTRAAQGQDAWMAVPDQLGGIVMFNKKTGAYKPVGPLVHSPAPSADAPPGAPAPLPGLPGKPTEGQRKKVLDASEGIAQLDMAIDALKKAPGAYGGAGNFVAGLAESAGGTPAQSLMSRRYNPDELRVKNYVSNVVSKIINERAGANVTLREELRQKFLPQDTDSLENAHQKLADLRQMMGTTYRAQGGNLVPDPNASGSVRVKRKSDGKTGNMPRASFNPDLYEEIK